MLPLSRGHTVVSHFLDVNAVDDFCWYEDGELRLHFEPLFASERDGSVPTYSCRRCGSWASTWSNTRSTTTAESVCGAAPVPHG